MEHLSLSVRVYVRVRVCMCAADSVKWQPHTLCGA